jgi:hypothetical protein
LIRSIAILLFLSFWFGGCNLLNPEKETIILAKIGDKSLFLSEIQPSIPENVEGADSALFVKEQVKKWVEQTLLLQMAELNLSESEKDIEKEIENYRKSLLIYAYEKAFISQKLDTLISDNEVANYYEGNLQNFELKDYVVKVLYTKLEKNAPQINYLRTMINNTEEQEVRYQLEDYCRQFATNYMLEDQVWLYFEDLLKEIPIKTYNIDAFLKNNKVVEIEDEQYLYFLVIKDYRLKDSVSPLELEKSRIKSIILNKRKLELTKSMRKDLYQDALNKNLIEYYTL